MLSDNGWYNKRRQQVQYIVWDIKQVAISESTGPTSIWTTLNNSLRKLHYETIWLALSTARDSAAPLQLRTTEDSPQEVNYTTDPNHGGPLVANWGRSQRPSPLRSAQKQITSLQYTQSKTLQNCPNYQFASVFLCKSTSLWKSTVSPWTQFGFQTLTKM